jgi:PmbA protein
MSKYLSIEEALQYGIDFALKKGADQIEGFSNKSKEITISVEKNIPQIETGISKGLSFRVVKNKNLGFGFTKTMTKDRIESTIKAAIDNAQAKGNDPDFKSLPQPSGKKVPSFDFDKKLDDVTSDSLAEDFAALIETINDTKKMSYLQGQVFCGIIEDHLLNSNGVDIKERTGGIGGYASAITTKGLIPNYSFKVSGGRKLEALNMESLAQETIELTNRVAAPKTINFQKEVPLILEPEACIGLLGGLFRLLINQLAGNVVDTGATPYSDQVGNQIASENFTFIDNGVHPNKLASSSYDAEGIPQERTVLIENGVLKTFLLDTYYGNKLGLESNGKSSRTGGFGFLGDSIKTPPSISSTTIEIESGDATKEEIVRETREGFMVRSLMGLHMSDFSSGRFSVTGFGWYIKNGEVKYPVQGIDISGKLPELIKKIDFISKEREEMLLADCPYIRFASVPVTAKKFDFKTRFGLTIIKILTTLGIMKHPIAG